MSKTIWCFIAGAGDSNPFSVKVEPKEFVDDLKNRIKTGRSSDLKDIDAANLTLYWAEVKREHVKERQSRVKEFQRLSQNLDKCEWLDETREVSECFRKDTQEMRYFCLVQLPQGELIYSFRAEWRCSYTARWFNPHRLSTIADISVLANC